MTIHIGLLDGTDGQAGVFREAIAKEFAQHKAFHVKFILTGIDEDLGGIDVLFVFPNNWEEAISSYQEKWADKAKEAGVRLFIPFEFGNPVGLETGDPPVIHTVFNLIEHCKMTKLDVCRVHTGPAMDVILPGILRIDPDTRTAQIAGKGDTPISFVTSTDVAKVVASHLSRCEQVGKLSGRTIRTTGDPRTYNEVLNLVSKLESEPITSVHRSIDEVKTSLPANIGPPNFLDWLMTCWEEGRAYLPVEENTEGFRYQTVEEVLKSNIARDRQ